MSWSSWDKLLVDLYKLLVHFQEGSGDVNENGILAAHNDVAFIRLPNNKYYTLAVFVKDFMVSVIVAAINRVAAEEI